MNLPSTLYYTPKAQKIQIPWPEIIIAYNKCMGGVDLLWCFACLAASISWIFWTFGVCALTHTKGKKWKNKCRR